jgi:ABC-type lipoprotein release transport system permease subunit
MLFGLEPTDVTTFALGCLLLATVALAAAWVPVRRAIGVDPAVVLRDD